ncbi:hypothetical protein RRG08_065943 [Elysia crispata]|uniref:H-type lectin domain-containing protein n=1 Tax=Elysia crispata TaxID=231223 RepID=A0AAE0ZFW4_9GAST|nr:hypothetical protein RRG08_065943 [Elysia crispata]
MQVSITSALVVCLVATTSVSGQINPLLFMMSDGGEELFGMENGMSLWMYNMLQKRIAALEVNVKSGAVGGCESGIIGPFTPGQMTGTITFQKPFLGAPAVSLALSDITVANPALNLNLQIRPDEISATEAKVTVTDATSATSSVHVGYMVCPSNSYASSSSP